MKKSFKIAVIIGAFTIVCSTFTACGKNANSIKNNSSTSKPAANTENNNNSSANTNQNTAPQNNEVQAIELVKGPDFTKTVLDKNAKISAATAWKQSPGNKINVCLQGKGEEAREEGIAKVVCKDSSGNMWQLALSDTKKQNTPMYVDWWDDDNLLVVVGYGYGTVSVGGNLYLLNVESGKSAVLVDNKDAKQQVVKASKSNKDIKYQLAVYEDSNMIKYNLQDKVLTSYEDALKNVIAGLK